MKKIITSGAGSVRYCTLACMRVCLRLSVFSRLFLLVPCVGLWPVIVA